MDFKRPRWGEDPLPIADVPDDDKERLDPMVNPNPDISNIQKKTELDRKLETEKPKSAATKTPQIKAAIPTMAAQAKPSKEKQIDADPFADIAAGVLADTLMPGASVVTDIINTITPDSADASDLPMVPGIPTNAGAGDEIGTGREPEAGD